MLKLKAQALVKDNIHGKRDDTDDNKYIVAAEMIEVFHHTPCNGRQSLRNHKFASINKISPRLYAIAPTVYKLL